MKELIHSLPLRGMAHVSGHPSGELRDELLVHVDALVISQLAAQLSAHFTGQSIRWRYLNPRN